MITGCAGSQSTSATTQPAISSLRQPVTTALGKVRKPLPYRIVSFHKGRADKKLIKLAADLGYNGVQIQIEGSTVNGIKAFAAYDAKEQLIAYCHSLGMAVTIWVHEFSDLPAIWLPESMGVPSVDNDAVWDVIDARYEWMLSQAIPNIDGLVLTTVETQVGATDTPVMVKLSKLIAEKCRKYQKQLVVRTFVWYPDEFANVMAGVDQLPKDQVIMSKCVPQDWNIRGTDAPELGNVGGRPQIEEFDAAGEYFMKNRVPNGMVELLKRQFDYGVAHGVQGVCVRVDRDDDSVLHEVSEVNVWAIGMFAGGATNSADDVWDAWATNRFGQAAAPGVVHTLKSAAQVVDEMLSIGRFSFGDTRKFPPMPDEDWLGQLHQNYWWDPKFEAEHQLAEKGAPSFTNEVAAAKKRAMASASGCLVDLELVKESLAPQDYAILRTRLLTLQAQTELRAYMALADLHYRQLINAATREERAAADDAMRTDLTNLRAAARPKLPDARKMDWLGRSWSVDQPEEIYRETTYIWAYDADRLRRGIDIRKPVYGHGYVVPATRPTSGK